MDSASPGPCPSCSPLAVVFRAGYSEPVFSWGGSTGTWVAGTGPLSSAAALAIDPTVNGSVLFSVAGIQKINSAWHDGGTYTWRISSTS